MRKKTTNLATRGQLWRITAPTFVAGLTVTQDGTVIQTAPILKHFANGTSAYVRRYCALRGWRIEIL